MTMGEKILNMRKARSWSQEELAEQVGVTRQAVSRWESGSVKPDADKIIALCDLFGVSADYLLRDLVAEQGNTIQLDRPVKPCISLESVLSWLMTAFGAVTLLVLGILASVNRIYFSPSVTESETGEQFFEPGGYTGLFDYLDRYALNWLFWLAITTLIAGAVMIIVRHGLHRRIWKWIDS